jgi:hypothetical protein
MPSRDIPELYLSFLSKLVSIGSIQNLYEGTRMQAQTP